MAIRAPAMCMLREPYARQQSTKHQGAEARRAHQDVTWGGLGYLAGCWRHSGRHEGEAAGSSRIESKAAADQLLKFLQQDHCQVPNVFTKHTIHPDMHRQLRCTWGDSGVMSVTTSSSPPSREDCKQYWAVRHSSLAFQPYHIVALMCPGSLQSEDVAYLCRVICVLLLGSLLVLL